MNGYFPSRVRKGDISFWIDGFGVPDRITSKAYTYTGTTSGNPIYSAKEIVFDGATSKIELGDVGTIKTILMWIKPDKSTNYLIDLDGGTTTVTLAPALTGTGWTSPSYYIDGKSPTTEYTVVRTGVYNFIAITTATAITANAVTVGCIGSDYLDGTVAGVIGLNVTLTQPEIQQIYQKQVPFDASLDKLISSLPSDITFFKDYTRKNGLTADYSIGIPQATFTCTRVSATASAGTYIDANGLIQLQPATNNTPRYNDGYYDSTGFHTVDSNGNSVRGLLIEGARTNLLQDSYFSQTITDYWSAAGTGAITTDTTYPNIYGGGNILKFVGSANLDRFTNKSTVKFATVSGTVYTLWSIVKGTGIIKYRFADGDGTLSYGTNTFTLDPNNWILISDTITSAATGGAGQAGWSQVGTDNVTAYFSIIQFEAGTYPTSPIPTTTASLTRNAEILRYAIAGNRTAAQETISIGFVPLGGSFANDGVIRHLIDTDADRVTMRKDTTATVMKYFPNLTDNNTLASIGTTTNLLNISYISSGISYGATAGTNSGIFLDGILEDTDTNNYTQPDMAGTYMYIGSSNAGITQINGIVKNISIHNRSLTDSELLSEANLIK